MNNILIGADPEVFVKQNGKFVSGHGLILGTKRDPFKVPNGAVQVDGMALEFNIDPASHSAEFVSNIESVLGQLAGMVPEYEIAIEAVATFDRDYIKQQPRAARELGCDPDFDPYLYRPNPRPNGDMDFRTAAGHVHIGWGEFDKHDSDHIANCCAVSKQLDLFLGVPSVIFDSNTQRRQLYGRAGAYRPKLYGVEYRVLSNKWLQSKQLMEFVFNNAVKAMKLCLDGDMIYEKITDAARTINTSDRQRAQQICDQLEITV